MNSSTIRVNGENRAELSATDRAVHFGDGLFETIRVTQGEAEFLGRHLARLRAGCERLKFPSIDWPGLQAEITQLLSGQVDAVLKVIVSRGAGGQGYHYGPDQQPTRILFLSPMPQWSREIMESGIRAIVCKTRLCRQPALAGIKHLNRLEQVLARTEWNDPEIHEGLMLDQGRRLVEGTKSNVFLLCGNELVTPALTGCGIAGIMRSVVLDLASELGLPVRIRAVALADLRDAGEVFVCNSLIGIWPVRSIEKVGRYPVGRITCDLIEALKEHRDSGGDRWYST